MNEELKCPDCGKKLKRDYGLPGVVVQCDCGETWVYSCGKLYRKSEFLKEVDAWHN